MNTVKLPPLKLCFPEGRTYVQTYSAVWEKEIKDKSGNIVRKGRSRTLNRKTVGRMEPSAKTGYVQFYESFYADYPELKDYAVIRNEDSSFTLHEIAKLNANNDEDRKLIDVMVKSGEFELTTTGAVVRSEAYIKTQSLKKANKVKRISGKVNILSQMAKASTKLRIAITTGEPAGVGPELMYHLSRHYAHTLPLHARCASAAEVRPSAAASADGDASTTSDATAPAAASRSVHKAVVIREGFEDVAVELVLIGNKHLLEERMKLFGDDFIIHDFDKDVYRASGPDQNGLGHISCLNVALGCASLPGVQDERNSQYVLQTLDAAIAGCKDGIFDAMVTAPISKSVIAKTGIEFTGHTEYLQEKCDCKEVVMMLGCSKMNVALVTTHLPLNKISEAITKEKLTDIITILHHDLKAHMGFYDPIIYVCGLNPHAGEDGTLGTEELETIIPVLEELKAKQGFKLIGPLPADTVFQKKYLDNAAAILTMYHDQGLPVLKYAGFDEGYNTTLGLPFIRTSVDHGTACDLAGKAIADEGSLLSAVSLALTMAHNRTKAKS